MAPFKPLRQNAHTTTFINGKLYILGGGNEEFFYLDASVSFNTQELLWNDLSSINIVPLHNGAASVKSGANNNTLFLYGGYSIKTMALVYCIYSISKIIHGVFLKQLVILLTENMV